MRKTSQSIVTWLAPLAAAPVALAAGCWPLDYTEDYAPDPPAAATGGGSAGGGGEGGCAPVTELFVDAKNGSDIAPGTEEEPFKTLKKALAVAREGQIVHLASGIYDAENGEDFATPVPDGVAISTSLRGEAVLRGSGVETALSFAGSGAAARLRIENFWVGVSGADGNLALKELDIAGTGQVVDLEGDVAAALTDSTIADSAWGIFLAGIATLSVVGGEIHGIGTPCSGAVLAGVTDAATLLIQGVVVRDSFASISAGDSGVVSLKLSTLDNVGSGGCGSGATIELTGAASVVLQDSVVTTVPGSVFRSYSSEARIEINGGIVNSGPGGFADGNGSLTIIGTSIIAGASGTTAIASGFGPISLEGATIQGYASAVEIGSGAAARIRTTEISGNNVGVRVSGGTLDMGTPQDAGGNALHGNIETGLIVVSGAQSAVGNTWLAWNQGTDGAGEFPLGTIKEGPFGGSDPAPRNVVVLNAGASVQLAQPFVLP